MSLVAINPELLLSVIAALIVLWLGTLSYIAVHHFNQDDSRNTHRRDEIKAMQAEHNDVIKLIYGKLEQHDTNQTSFRIEMEKRLTRIETRLESVLASNRA